MSVIGNDASCDWTGVNAHTGTDNGLESLSDLLSTVWREQPQFYQTMMGDWKDHGQLADPGKLIL